MRPASLRIAFSPPMIAARQATPSAKVDLRFLGVPVATPPPFRKAARDQQLANQIGFTT
jgi:hypothetical protein